MHVVTRFLVTIVCVAALQSLAWAQPAAPEQEQPSSELKTEARQNKASLGIRIGRVQEGAGVAVVGVASRGPAGQNGLERGDVILSIDGQQIQSPEQLVELIDAKQPGDRVELKLKRGDQEISRQVALGRGGMGRMCWIGVMIGRADEGASGVLIARIHPDGPARKARLERGDLVISVDGQEIAGPRELARMIREKQPGDTLAFEVRRGDQEMHIDVTLEPMPDFVAERPQRKAERSTRDGASSER